MVGELEERLPASPWWGGEWSALNHGTDRSRYWPLSHVEKWVPVTFALLHAAGLLSVFVA